MPYPVIPEYITVHLGAPDAPAENVTVTFPRYIKGVAASEIYPTWNESAIRANVLAQISVALNRVYTEFYRSRGYDFDITNNTQYDQAFSPNKETFENINAIVDDMFNNYIVRRGNVEPLYAQFCDGVRTQCAGLSQWGSVELAEQGLTPYEILQHYFGENIDIVSNAPMGDGLPSYPGRPLERGSVGEDVRTIQQQLNRIRKNYPAIPPITEVSNVFDEETENAVRAFQRIFNLEPDGVVGKATWYRIKAIYNGVKSLSEVSSEGLTLSEAQRQFPEVLRLGDSGIDVQTVRFYLAFLGFFLPELPYIRITDQFDEELRDAVYAFQQVYGLTVDGVVGRTTWQKLYEVYNDIANKLLSASLRPGEYPGILRRGSTGTAVRELQFYLYLMSAYESSIPVVSIDGSFGAATENAVRAYQRFAGLTVDGIVGRKTWDSLYGKASALRSSGPVVTLKRLPYPGTPLTVGTDSSAVLYYTLLLQRIAYYYDSVASPALSSQYTQETADATASAQELLGLPATGVADAETWTAVEALSLQLAAFTPNPDRHPEQGPDYPDRAMKEGSAGPDVSLIEGWLNDRSQLYCEEDYVPDNAVFGPEDTAAVKDTQQRAGLETNGVVDRPTWAAIRAQSHTACDNCTEEG